MNSQNHRRFSAWNHVFTTVKASACSTNQRGAGWKSPDGRRLLLTRLIRPNHRKPTMTQKRTSRILKNAARGACFLMLLMGSVCVGQEPDSKKPPAANRDLTPVEAEISVKDLRDIKLSVGLSGSLSFRVGNITYVFSSFPSEVDVAARSELCLKVYHELKTVEKFRILYYPETDQKDRKYIATIVFHYDSIK